MDYTPKDYRPQWTGGASQAGGQNTSPFARGALSTAEWQESKRLQEEDAFSFEGYQVVRREFMASRFDPVMTMKENCISFNNACISKLENATYINVLINPDEQRMAIRICDEGAKDAIRWCLVKGEKRQSRQITCKPFTERVYEMMGWDPLVRYKMQGMQINHKGEPLYLFDMKDARGFAPAKKDPQTGKVKKGAEIRPEGWQSSFGMSVADHEAASQVDLEKGYIPKEEAEQSADGSQEEVEEAGKEEK